MALRFLRLLLPALIILGLFALACAGHPTPLARQAPLHLVDFSPEGEVRGELGSLLLTFDRPAVDPSTIGTELTTLPVSVEPPLPLEGRWIDAQRLVLTPLVSPTPATRYEVRITGALAAQTAEASAVPHAFVYRPLSLVEVRGSDPELRWLEPRPLLELHFSTEVRSADVADHCAIHGADGSEHILDIQAPLPESTQLTAQPRTDLAPGADFELRCTELAAARGNVRALALEPLPLHTRPAFSVLSVSPAGGRVTPNELELSVEFSTPVEREALLERLQLEPKVTGFAQAWVRRDETHYVAVLDLTPTTDYVMRLGAGLKDRFGRALPAGFVARFSTRDAAPALQVETGIYAVETSAKGYPVWTRNLENYALRCARVPEKQLASVLVSELSYDPWYNHGQADTLDFAALGLKEHKRLRSAEAAKNHWRADHLDLPALCGGQAEKGKKGARGVYLAELSNEAVRAQRAERGWGRYPYRVLANVTDLGVLLKVGPRSGLIWVTSIQTGEPVADAKVRLYDPQGKALRSGRTDAQGLWQLPGAAELLPRPAQAAEDSEEYAWEEDAYRQQRLIAVVQKGDDLAVVDGNWQNGIQIWNFGFDGERSPGPKLRALIQSDRGIYRPGETVSFKGFVRELVAGKSPRVPDGREVSVRIEDPRGSALLEAKRPLSDFGGFDLALALPESAALGDYRVSATLQGQRFDERFSVEEFRPVGFELSPRTEPAHFALGQRVRLAYEARYLFGAPLAKATVRWQVSRRPHWLRFPGYEAYGFEDGAARDDFYPGYDEYGSDGTSFVGEGETTSDDKGRFGFVLRDPARKLDTAQDYLISVSATDPAGQTVTRRSVLVGDPQDFYLGLHPQEWVQAVGMPFAIDAVAVDRDGVRRAATAELSFARRSWSCRDSGDYRAQTRCERHDSKLWSRELGLDASGSNTTPIVPDAPGEYVIRLSSRDASGRAVVASSTVWVVGKGEAFWSGDESARMSVVASRDSYAPGDTALLVPRADTRAAHLLLTLERDGVLEARVIKPEQAGEGISVPIQDSYAPNLYASIALVRGRSGEGDAARPQFRLGMVELKVSPEARRLAVRVQTEREAYQPGEKVRGKVSVEQAGRGVDAELSLSVADEGVLQLVAYRTPDPMALFYAPHGLGVDSSTNLNRLARPNAPLGADEEEAGGDGPGEEPSRVRSRFVRSALWLPALRTGADGEVEFEFDAPDNLTAFRLMAVVADRAERFGSAEARIRVDKPLLAQPALPRFVGAGDEVELGAVLHNRTTSAQHVTVTLQARGLILRERSKQLDLAAGAQRAVLFHARAEKVDSARVELQVRSATHSDAFVHELPVRRALATEQRVLVQARLETGGHWRLAWPAEALPADSTLEVTVDPTGLARLEHGLRYLIEYPYGCLEQTLSRLIPMFALRELTQSLPMKDLDGQALERFVALGVAKLLRHQHPDGNFSLWPGAHPEPHLTAYALWGFALGREAGVKVDDAALQSGLDALARWTQEQPQVLRPDATQAMAALVLALHGRPDHGLLARLYEVRASLSMAGRAQLLQALRAAHGDAGWIEALTGELWRDATPLSSWTVEYGPHFDMASPVRDQAIVLRALLEANPQHPRVLELVDDLLAAQGPDGRWGNTQENIYALLALADYARHAAQGRPSVTLELGGKRLVQQVLEGGAVLRFARPASALPAGELVLRSDAPVHAVLRQKLVREVAGAQDARPLSRGFAIERRYLDPKSGAELTQFAVGQLVQVEVRVQTSDTRAYVAVVDPLPAGVEPVQTRLATEVAGAPSDHWHWDHTELRDDRALAFLDRMGPGLHRFRYLVRATSAGRFLVPAPQVEAMYEPELRALGAVRELQVVR
jgi:uncharacterized protein YfaS (alpha-2-macroglobulin family)